MINTTRSVLSRTALAAFFSCGIGMIAASGGCEQKEKVLDIKGPGIDLEVNKTTSGDHEIEIKSDRKDRSERRKIEIETTK